MGRSVSTLKNSDVDIYFDATNITDSYEWDDMLDELSLLLRSKYKSLKKDNRWEGENLIFLSNNLIEISISEYCGCGAICIRGIEGENFGSNLANKMGTRVREIVSSVYGKSMRRIGTFSNGESVYEQVN